ncbi:MAG TPA: helix-turn-helix domain-containing protein, partial [Candidatus Nanoarchaeia archaeon]|nr:helix-turn-helix domain-containing protein [Candidatus Nanoarchaeia archaeon]
MLEILYEASIRFPVKNRLNYAVEPPADYPHNKVMVYFHLLLFSFSYAFNRYLCHAWIVLLGIYKTYHFFTTRQRHHNQKLYIGLNHPTVVSNNRGKNTMIVKEDFLKKLRAAFDLNIYEVKIWTALLSKGVSSAGELSDISNVPRSR